MRTEAYSDGKQRDWPLQGDRSQMGVSTREVHLASESGSLLLTFPLEKRSFRAAHCSLAVEIPPGTSYPQKPDLIDDEEEEEEERMRSG